MLRKLILASHGKFASGIYSSLALICGKMNEIEVLDAYVEEDFSLSTRVEDIMQRYKEYELIVLTDIFGGSVNNEFLKYINRENYYLISGLNLSLLIEIATKIKLDLPFESVVTDAVDNSKEMIQLCNKTIKKKILEDEF
ncbi:PTS sugar transporter subunit IIA [Trichococcus flocculiformis]|uniref:PTS sugar transporter subunit IIA n=1 Tax=Trichococcus flocculiformis TaxID=82803 RepID=UPI003DA4E18B